MLPSSKPRDVLFAPGGYLCWPCLTIRSICALYQAPPVIYLPPLHQLYLYSTLRTVIVAAPTLWLVVAYKASSTLLSPSSWTAAYLVISWVLWLSLLLSFSFRYTAPGNAALASPSLGQIAFAARACAFAVWIALPDGPLASPIRSSRWQHSHPLQPMTLCTTHKSKHWDLREEDKFLLIIVSVRRLFPSPLGPYWGSIVQYLPWFYFSCTFVEDIWIGILSRLQYRFDQDGSKPSHTLTPDLSRWLLWRPTAYRWRESTHKQPHWSHKSRSLPFHQLQNMHAAAEYPHLEALAVVLGFHLGVQYWISTKQDPEDYSIVCRSVGYLHSNLLNGALSCSSGVAVRFPVAITVSRLHLFAFVARASLPMCAPFLIFAGLRCQPDFKYRSYLQQSHQAQELWDQY